MILYSVSIMAKQGSRAPALTDYGRESRIISKAYDLVEQRIDNGTATSQETTHFLKQGSQLALLEQEKIRNENLLLAARIEEIKTKQTTAELYDNAIAAMRRYSGVDSNEDDDY